MSNRSHHDPKPYEEVFASFTVTDHIIVFPVIFSSSHGSQVLTDKFEKDKTLTSP